MLLTKIVIRWLAIAALLIFSRGVLADSGASTLRHGTYALPMSLDPAWGTTSSDNMLKVNIYEGLVTYDAAGKVVPGAAKRWDVSDDGLRYTFHLRKGLRWSDGAPLFAQQFANTILRVLKGKGDNQPTIYYTLLKNATEILQQKLPLSALGMKVIDQHTLSFELSRPAPYFPQILIFSGLPTPASENETSPEELKPDKWITNGAYQVSAYDPTTRQFQFVKNPYYRKNEHTYFESVQLQHFLLPNQAFLALATNQLDAYERYSGGQLKAMSEEKELVKVIPLESTVTDYITINIKDKVLKDRRIRRALSMALDRSAIVKLLGYEDTQKAFSFSPSYPNLNWQALPAVWKAEGLDSRRQRALTLLTEAGYGLNQRLKLDFLINKGDSNELLAESVRRQWANIGVDITVISHPTAVHYGEYLAKGRYQVARAGWGAVYPGPSSFLEVLHSQQKNNSGRWENAAYTQKLDQLMQQPMTPKQRSATFWAMESIIQQEVPIIPIYYKLHSALFAPWLKTINQQRADYLLWRHFQPK